MYQISWHLYTVQEHLTWSRHINHLISKLRSVLGTVIKVKSLINKRSLLLYHSLINSQLFFWHFNLVLWQ